MSLIAAAIALAMTLLHIQVSRAAIAERLRLAAQRQSLSQYTPAFAAGHSSYVERLRANSSVETVLNTLQAISKALNVKVVSVAIQRHAPAEQTLGHDDLSISMRGRFADLKQSLAETLDRHRHAVVQHLTITSSSSPSEQEMQLTFSLLRAPSSEGAKR